MKIPIERFQNQLLKLYALDPAKYTPFALWKMQKMTGEGQAFHLPEFDCYYVIRDKQLLFYTSADQKCHLPLKTLNGLDFIVMNPDILDSVKDRLEGFNISYGWTLYYNFNHRPEQKPNPRYAVVDFDFASESHFQIAADIINGGAGGFMNAQRMRKWTAFPSYDPSLWFFMQDTETQKLVSIGISTFHQEAKETDLDWIFVLPAYQGKGAGRTLIAEIIHRSAQRSNVIRVGGLEAFYKRCGFFEKERWGYAVKPGFGMNEQ